MYLTTAGDVTLWVDNSTVLREDDVVSDDLKVLDLSSNFILVTLHLLPSNVTQSEMVGISMFFTNNLQNTSAWRCTDQTPENDCTLT